MIGNKSDWQATDALVKFRQNFDKLEALSRLTGYGVAAIGTRIDELRQAISELDTVSRLLEAEVDSGPGRDHGKRVKSKLRQYRGEVATHQRQLDSITRERQLQDELRRELPIPLLVAHAEAYLHDGLAEMAAALPSAMNETTQSANYAEITSFSSIEDLTAELRSRWARNWVDDGGPARWVERLTKLGARTYPPDTAIVMEVGWGIRHMIIHRAGIASRDFVARHPKLGATAGAPVPIPEDFLTVFSLAVVQFVTITDRYIATRIARAAPRAVRDKRR